MSRRGSLLAACVALSLALACSSEVTIHLLRSSTTAGGASGTGGQNAAGEAGAVSAGGNAGDANAGAAGEAGNAGDANAGSGQAGSSSTVPCQTLGPEVCNGGDDDCNGTTDEGCEYTIAWAPEPNGGTLGHATGGVTFLEPCPIGTVLTGLRIGMGNWLNQVEVVCHQVELHVDTSQSTPSFSVALGQRVDEPFVPATSTDTKNQVQELSCPDGLILSGVDGTTTTDTAHYILGIRITCAPPIVSGPESGPILDTDASQQKMVGPLVCVTCSATQAYNYTMAIGAGHVATGIYGGDGLWIDRVGFSASVGSVTAK